MFLPLALFFPVLKGKLLSAQHIATLVLVIVTRA